MSKVVIFDLDGTLIDTRRAIRRACGDNLPFPTSGKTELEILRACGINDSMLSLYYVVLQRELEIEKPRVVPHGKALFDAERENGSHLAICSGNTTTGMRLKLAALRDQQLEFDALSSYCKIFCCDMPAPKTHLMSAMSDYVYSLSASEVVYVGNNVIDERCAEMINARYIDVKELEHATVSD